MTSTPNQTLSASQHPEAEWRLLFGLSLGIATLTFLGGWYSLVSLLRMRSRSSLCLLVASLSVDDLISVVPQALFMLLQWRGAGGAGTVCTLSGLLYVFQGLSGNIKACLIVAYTFYVTKRFGVHQTPGRPAGVLGVVVVVWMVSLLLSLPPVCGWGGFSPSALGCFPEKDGVYVLLLLAVYSLCFCGLVGCSVPVLHQLMCSGEALRSFGPRYVEMEIPSLSSLEKSSACDGFGAPQPRSPAVPCAPQSPVLFSQKRFSMILAMARIVLWMPMMTQILVSHAVHMHNSSLETLCFFLTLLSAAVTPVFVLSERWIHLPCGCFINCGRGLGPQTAKRKRFEFNLSFQQGYGLYTLSHARSMEKPSFNSLYSCDFSESRVAVLESGQIGKFSTRLEDSSLAPPHSSLPPQTHQELSLDNSSVFDAPERRLSHEECRKIELSDWEWCRSKSERTPRQRSTAGLAIPICAFQGTVSLHAPTGKTLSLSTYEVSSDGLKISPNNAKKVEVYRSKSVGHEPSADDPDSASVGGGVADTNVKIHLEVLEICDNEEAMDSVSIVSNISQSSAHARSPSLRYSRRENRFVSCDLGETASYSLLIPTSIPDADSINIHIPDTVEAHRQNSRRQHQEAGGYREEIQLLNEAYRRQEEHQGN